MHLDFIKSAFATLFVALDPPGLIAIFIGLTSHMVERDRKQTAYLATMIATGILWGVALGGQHVLDMLGIGIPAFRIAGGLLLFYIAVEMVFEKRTPRKSHTAEEVVEHEHPRNIAAFPLAIPLMAGPGAITATILQASLAGNSIMNYIALLGVLAAVTLCCLVCFLLAVPFDRMLGNTGRVVMSRLLGILLAALAVQIIGDGITSFTHS